jgi:hypothetical protein
MANKKFSEFTVKTSTSDVDFVVGYDGTDNVRITPANLAPAAPVTSVNSLTGAVSLGLTQLDDVGSDGTNGQVLTTNGSGSFTFTTASGGATSLNGLSDVTIDNSTNSAYLINVPTGLSGNVSDNLVIGIGAGEDITNANDNTIIGNEAGASLTYGEKNVFIGGGAAESNISGYENVVIGKDALQNGTNVRSTVAIGWEALHNNTQEYGLNVAVGSSAGRNSNSAQYCTYIGTGAGSQGYFNSNVTTLGYASQPSGISASNEITLGNSSIATLRCAVTSITSISDERDKSEIKDLEYGLAFIDALQPREFVWDNRVETRTEFDDEGNETQVEFYSANKGKKDFGFIAQEVRELDNDTLRLVYTENEEKLELSYGKLVPILVKAIQELKEEVELLKS